MDWAVSPRIVLHAQIQLPNRPAPNPKPGWAVEESFGYMGRDVPPVVARQLYVEDFISLLLVMEILGGGMRIQG
jgi:hypothetical protein